MSKVVRIVAIIIALGVMTFAGVQLGTYFYERAEDHAVNDELTAIADSPLDPADERSSEEAVYTLEEVDAQNKLLAYAQKLFGKAAPNKMPISGNQKKSSLEKAQKRRINFPALKNKNGQIVAWISVPNMPIDYAVVRGKDNSYYLKHDAMRKSSKSGAIFLDSKAKSDFSSSDSIIYGHDMSDGTMFGSLYKYRNKKFRGRHQYIFVYTPKATKKYRVTSCFTTKSSTLKPDNSRTKTLTLVTCANASGKSHYVVRAQLVSSKAPGKK
jgi:SrtB family sortase